MTPWFQKIHSQTSVCLNTTIPFYFITVLKTPQLKNNNLKPCILNQSHQGGEQNKEERRGISLQHNLINPSGFR